MVKSQSRGFTLLELLIVMAIIGILMAILFPTISAVYRSAMEVQCQSRIGELAKAVAAYCQQYDGKFPFIGYGATPLTTASANDWLYVGASVTQTTLNEGLLVKNKFVGKTDIFFCPLDDLKRSSGQINLNGKGVTSYVINASITYHNKEPYGAGIGRCVRRYEEFNPGDYLFFEEGEDALFSVAYMLPDTRFWLTGRHRDGGYIAYMDGSVHWRSKADFNTEIQTLNWPVGSLDWWKKTGNRWNPG